MDEPDRDLVEWAFAPGGASTPMLRRAVTELLGSDPGPIELLRRGSNVVLRAPAAQMILRLQHVELADAVEANLDLVLRLKAVGAPVVAPARPYAVRTDDIVLTAWPLGEPVSSDAAVALGGTLAALHAVPPPADLRRVNISDRFDQRLAELPPDLPTDIVKALTEHASLAVETLDAASGDAEALLHGDAHVGNLVLVDNEPRLIDLDDLCYGPREFDLVPSLVSYQRFHRDDERWASFTAAYGPQVDWDLVDSLTVVREATMNSWLAGLWNHDAGARDELVRRVATWDEDWRSHEPWQAM